MSGLRSSSSLPFGIGQAQNKLPITCLPTYRMMFQRFYYEMLVIKRNVKQSSVVVAEELTNLWQKENIPTKEKQHVISKIKDEIYEEMVRVKKNIKRRDNKQLQKEQNLTNKLDKLFDIAHADAMTKMSVQNDRDFLIDQRGERKMMIGKKLDKRFMKKVQKRRERIKLQAERKAKEETRMSLMNQTNLETVGVFSSDSSEETDGEELYAPETLASAKTQQKQDFIELKINKRSWLNNVALLADKNAISSRQALEVAASSLILPDTPGTSKSTDINEITLSVSTLHRRRETLRNKSAVAIKEKFCSEIRSENAPHFLLHWDGKCMKGFKHVDKKVEKLAVVLTCTSKSNAFSEKVLDVCEIPNSSAEECFKAVTDVLEKEGPELKPLILGGVFDTTAVNTGWKNGVMVKLEKYIGEKLLHIHCRHHIFERICSDIVAAVLGDTNAPEYTIYQDLTSAWASVNTCDYSSFHLHHLPKSIRPIAEDFICFAQAILKEDESDFTVKDDYRELLQLGLLLFDSIPRDSPTLPVRSIGCISNARWMSKVICEQKIALYSHQLCQLGMLKSNIDVEQHRNLALFLTLFYVKPWLQCPLPFEAAVNDLNLFNHISNLQCKQDLPPYFHKFIAATLNRLDAHLWYVSEEMVFLALFSKQISDTEKEQCRKELLKNERKSNITLQKLGKMVTPELKKGTKIKSLIGPNSFLIPTRMKVEAKFLKVRASEWEQDSSYNFFENALGKLQVTNDAAERAILLAKTYHNKLTTAPAQRSNLYQVVPELRKKIPDKRKTTLLKANLVDDEVFNYQS